MRKKIMFAALFCGAQAFAAVIPVRADEIPGPGSAPAADEPEAVRSGPFDIRVKGRALSEVLDIVSQRWPVSFTIVDPDLAERKVTLFLRNAALAEIIEILEKAKDLDFQRMGDSDNYIVKRSTVIPPEFPPLTQQDLADPMLGRMITVRLKNAPLVTFLDVICAQSRINFILGGDVEDIKVTVLFKKVTIVDILQFLKAYGLSVSRLTGRDLFIIRGATGVSKKLSNAEYEFENKKYEEAIRIYGELYDKFPDSEMADYALLKVAVNYDWIAARDNDTAALRKEEEALLQLISRYPKSARLGDAYLYLGQIYSGHGGAKREPVDCIKAEEYYRLALKTTYRDWVKAQAQARIAQCRELAGEKEKARAMYKDIVKNYPNTEMAKEAQALLWGPDKLVETGRELERQREYALAMDVYKRVIEKGASPESVKEAQARLAACREALSGTEKTKVAVKPKK